jgi:hypothetical protein
MKEVVDFKRETAANGDDVNKPKVKEEMLPTSFVRVP